MIVQPKERTCEVTRSFHYKGESLEIGAVVVLENAFAHEMKHAGAVKFVDANPVPVKTEPDALPNEVPPAKRGKDK